MKKCARVKKMRKKVAAQSAMEYLMTYGWAILIIAVVLGALFQLGVFNSSSFSPRAPPGACQVFRPGGPGSTTNINLMGVCTGQLPQYVAKFDGASSYVRIPLSTNLPNNFFNGDEWAFSSQILRSSTSPANSDFFQGQTHKPRFRWYGGVIGVDAFVGGTYIGIASAPSPSNNVFHHIVITSSYSGNYLRIYVDGGLSGSSSFVRIDSGATYYLLSANHFATEWWNGTISNVQIYNTSLTANQIQALYLQGIGGAPMKLQNLVGWWPLNGNSNDYSGNNNNGVPTALTFTSQYGK